VPPDPELREAEGAARTLAVHREHHFGWRERELLGERRVDLDPALPRRDRR